jgi:uncharacterized glyoxalase superfamily protein PhnB
MTELTPYLLFDGNCAEAMRFYQSCLGGQLNLLSVGDSPMQANFPAELHQKIVNATLLSGNISISASDWLRADRTRAQGNTVCLYLNSGSYQDTEEHTVDVPRRRETLSCAAVFARRSRKLLLRSTASSLPLLLLTLLGVPSAVASTETSATPLIAYSVFNHSGQNDVWTANVNGGSQQVLGPGSAPLVAPTGTLVAASLQTNEEPLGTGVVLYSTTGASPVQVESLAGESVKPLAFSANAHYLALLVGAAASTTGQANLDVLDVETGLVTDIARGDISGVSFNPAADGELVYARAPAEGPNPRFDLYIWAPGDISPHQITNDGRSLSPVWGPQYIAYDQQYTHGRFHEPGAQIWLRTPAGVAHRLTDAAVGELQYGLTPIAFSASGSRLLAEYGQQDIPEAWIVSVPSGHAHRIKVSGQEITLGAGISADGNSVLMTVNIYRGDALATVPANGGAPKLLVKHGYEPSWSE